MSRLTRRIELLSSQTQQPTHDVILDALTHELHDCEVSVRPQSTSNFINEVWHKQMIGNSDSVAVFSAFYDDRKSFSKTSAFIRLFTVTTSTLTQQLFCQVWYAGLDRPLVTTANFQDTGRGLGYNGKKYQERMYSCEVPRTLPVAATHVSLVSSECDHSDILVPVEVAQREQVHDLGVCVVVAYGDINQHRLIEWVELNRILGVKEINVYDSRVSSRTRQVFQFYEETGFLQVRRSAPAVEGWCVWCQKLSAIATLNDCLYRNMFRYKHVAVIDFDEVILPHQHDSIPDMLAHLRSTWHDEPPAFIFRNAYFFLDSPPAATSKEEALMTSKFTARQDVSEFGYSSKSITNPRRCSVVQNHYCMERAPDVSSRWYLSVDAAVGLNHHYKMCHFESVVCERLVRKTTVDTSALRFRDRLVKAVRSTLKELATRS